MQPENGMYKGDSMQKFDVTALGELLIDFTYAGQSTNGAALFEQNPGGAPANVLTAVRRLGGNAAFIGKVGRDMHGEFLEQTLQKNGIDTEGLLMDENSFTTLAFVNLDENGDRSFSFARKPGADTCLHLNEVRFDLIESSFIFHIGSLSLTDEPVRSATLAALHFAKEKGVIISYDPNYRAMLWKDEKTAAAQMRSVLPFADVIKLSDEELLLVTGETDPSKAASVLLAQGISCVLITCGAEGAVVSTQTGTVTSPAQKVKVIDTTGAGDAFMGGFLYMLSAERKSPSALTLSDARRYAEFAGRVAACCVSHRGAICAMPTMEEVKRQ